MLASCLFALGKNLKDELHPIGRNPNNCQDVEELQKFPPEAPQWQQPLIILGFDWPAHVSDFAAKRVSSNLGMLLAEQHLTLQAKGALAHQNFQTTQTPRTVSGQNRTKSQKAQRHSAGRPGTKVERTSTENYPRASSKTDEQHKLSAKRFYP